MNQNLKSVMFAVALAASAGAFISVPEAAEPVPQGTKGSVTHYDSTGVPRGGANPGGVTSQPNKNTATYKAPPQTDQDTTSYDLDGDGVENIRDLCPTIKEEIEYQYSNPEYPGAKGFTGGCNGLYVTGDVNCGNTCYYGSKGGAGRNQFRFRVSYLSGTGNDNDSGVGSWSRRKDTRVECRYSNEPSTNHSEYSFGCGCRPGQRLVLDPANPFTATGGTDSFRGYACGASGDVTDFGDYGPSTPVAGKNDKKCSVANVGFLCE